MCNVAPFSDVSGGLHAGHGGLHSLRPVAVQVEVAGSAADSSVPSRHSASPVRSGPVPGRTPDHISCLCRRRVVSCGEGRLAARNIYATAAVDGAGGAPVSVVKCRHVLDQYLLSVSAAVRCDASVISVDGPDLQALLCPDSSLPPAPA